MNKKVIFIGGTSYSGSTMLDMILANDPKGYSLGEIHAIFRPYRKHHLEEIEKLKKDDKWREILKAGEDELYKNLFKYFPNIEFFVDSSKNPLWIKKHIRILKEQNIHYKNILIFKTPVEIAYSFNKRGLYKKWERSYINYHRLYFTLINDFRTVAYKNFVKNETTLEKLCSFLDIPYFKRKEEFWDKEHQTFFGNNRARIHTSNLTLKGDEKIDLLKDKNEYRKVYYEEVTDQEIINKVNLLLSKNKLLSNIVTILNLKNILTTEQESHILSSKLHFNILQIILRELKENIIKIQSRIIY